MEVAQRENRALAEEIRVLLDKLSTKEDSINRLDNHRKGGKVKKKELHCTQEQKENRVRNSQLDIGRIGQEI